MMKLVNLDPRVKLLMLVGFSTAAQLTKDKLILLALCLVVLISILAGGIKLAFLWRSLRGLYGLIVVLFILQCLFNRKGETLLSIGAFTLVTDMGLTMASILSMRLLVFVLSALIISNGDSRDYLLAFTKLKIPYEIAFMVLLAIRFLPMLREESHDVLCAAQMRGLRVKNIGLRKQITAFISVVTPITARTIQQSEQISIAMDARAFRAYPQRSNMRNLKMSKTDWIYLIIICIVITSSIILTFSGGFN